jgi:hypothetical protein
MHCLKVSSNYLASLWLLSVWIMHHWLKSFYLNISFWISLSKMFVSESAENDFWLPSTTFPDRIICPLIWRGSKSIFIYHLSMTSFTFDYLLISCISYLVCSILLEASLCKWTPNCFINWKSFRWESVSPVISQSSGIKHISFPVFLSFTINKGWFYSLI